MFIKAELFIDNKEYNILEFSYRYTQPINKVGRPLGNIQGGLWNIRVETTQDRTFTEWAASPTMMKNAKIVVYPATYGKPYTLELYDVFCTFEKVDFHHSNNQPIITALVLSPAQIAINGEMQYQKLWKITEVMEETEATRVVEDDDEPRIVDSYFEDETGEKATKVRTDKTVHFIIKSKNMVGKSVDIDLSDSTIDFEYQGSILTDDVLEDLTITANTMKIELKTLKQSN